MLTIIGARSVGEANTKRRESGLRSAFVEEAASLSRRPQPISGCLARERQIGRRRSAGAKRSSVRAAHAPRLARAPHLAVADSRIPCSGIAIECRRAWWFSRPGRSSRNRARMQRRPGPSSRNCTSDSGRIRKKILPRRLRRSRTSPSLQSGQATPVFTGSARRRLIPSQSGITGAAKEFAEARAPAHHRLAALLANLVGRRRGAADSCGMILP